MHGKGLDWHKQGSASEDPLVVTQFGDLWVDLQGSIALADRAATKVAGLLDCFLDFDEALRGKATVDVAAAKIHASRTALSVTAKIFEPLGSRAAHNSNGFDRFWRDAWTHTLHDPLAYKVLEAGDFALNDRYTEVGSFS
ncbi:acyl-CoA dehydrogenase family protein [Breoghania sp.]|uniref:acyl-CoA dehydrogenase family protein n=1 Tax=Breoghania sp. TaxID=2065378 RepID=UPI00260F21B1|nr:acyl-CoA dehydrogenase family protein [Breoghania sp.]MDJ0931756.1 acyl-CoA dehydrogenase family protein [Breoghania sp.]